MPQERIRAMARAAKHVPTEHILETGLPVVQAARRELTQAGQVIAIIIPANLAPRFTSAAIKHVPAVRQQESVPALIIQRHHATPDITSADQTASPALREPIPKAVRLPLVPVAVL